MGSNMEQIKRILKSLPRCPQHPEYPYVTTLSQKIKNDILEITEKGITVRSHKTNKKIS